MDYASCTPVSRSVFRAMKPYFMDIFYNPSSLYYKAKIAKEAVEKSRGKVARVLHAQNEEIFFVSGGTESINLAILGTLKKAKKEGIKTPEIIVGAIEHPAVLETVKSLENENLAKIIYITPNEEGIISAEKVLSCINQNTILVTIGYANNEIGVVEPISQIGGKIIEWRNANKTSWPLFHTDASAAANYLTLNRDTLKVDLMSFDSSKIYGPKGIGILFIKRGIKLSPVFYGGSQERGMRPGTESVPQIIGLGVAIEETDSLREREIKRLKSIQKYFIGKIKNNIPSAVIIGSIENRLPNNVHICIPGLNSEFATIALGERGIFVSPMTSCNTLLAVPKSQVLEALGFKNCASSSLRFSMGRETLKRDIDMVIKILPEIIKLARNT